ncbi:sickle tail protein homolog isoform X1 [Anguilla rostrata]
MQPSDMDKKREAFLEHLKQKYPHHASAIMGHQERLREQALQFMLSSLHSELDIQRYLLKIESSRRSRSPKHSPNPQPGVGDLAEHLSVASLESLDAMSEGEAPAAFTRGTRTRASLPVVRSANQTKDRSLGVLYLQYGDETKQIRMPNEITSADTIRALFVSAFPQQLTMKMLESPSVAVYIKDDARNMYYELSDVRNIMDHSFLKVYHKDPAHVFSHNARPTNGDSRMHREMLYGGREGQLTLSRQPMSPPAAHPMAGTLPPNAGLSMPPSPSRIPYGPRGGAMPGNATLPRDRLSSVPPNRSVSPCPSAILERRDVKPDEDVSSKGVALARGEGLYADPYLMHEGRLSIASSHSGHPGDVPDHGMGGFHRASVRSNSSYASSTMSSDGAEHHSLYRQKSRKYGDSQLPTLGSKTPPPSPHRMADVRLVDIHPGQAAHIPPQGIQMERGSPVRHSFRKDSSGGVETVTKARSNMASPVIPDLPMGQGDRPPHAMSSNDPQTRERMKAMEQQIASLTGLVQHALFKGPTASSAKEASSDKMVKRASPVHSANSGGASPILAAKSPAESSPTPPPLAAPAPLQANLAHFRKNVSDLRLQLLQMRQLQLQNQETLKLMVKRAEQEISGKLVEAVKRLEDPAQRQRVLVEEDRHKYLSMEERVLVQLGELEQYVDELKKDSASSAVQRAVTLKDVEEGAVGLRKVGESLAGLKGEFPALQTKMRAVLRVEVEAVKFLKEEPHKLDSMLKRVKNLTETLSSLRRLVTDGPFKGSESLVVRETSAVAVVESEPPPSAVQDSSPPPPSSASPTGLPEPQSSSIRSEVMPASPLVIHHAQSSPVHIQQSLQSAALVHQPSPPLTPSQERHSPTLAKISTPTMGNSPALSKKPVLNPEPPPSVAESNSSAPQNLLIEEVHSSREKSKQRAKSIEAAEKEWAERRQNMGQYDGKEFDKILQEAQANMMKGIPSLEVGEEEAPTAPPAVQGDEVDTPQPVESPPKEAPVPEASPEKPVQPSPEPRALSSPPPVAEKPAKILPEKPAKPSLDKVAKLNAEKACKSPPPPPPRRNYPPGSGLTTGRSGEVIFTSRKESVSAQEGEEEAAPPQPPKPSKVPPEIKPKPQTPPPIVASAICDEEDEGDKIMAELQVFQKCTVKDLGPKCFIEHTRVEPQVRELRPGSLMLPKDKKQNSDLQREEKESHTDENGNDTMRQSPGVIYYVTAQISKEQQPSPGAEDQPERKEAPVSPSQVANNTSVASSASRMPVPVSAKSRQPPGGTEKAGKQQKLQDPQRQFRQANGSAKKTGGENKSNSPTLPASKIPAFYPSSGKNSPLSAPNSDATNPVNSSSSSSSSSKSSIPSPSHANPSRPASVSSHIPSLSNGTLKLPSSTHTGKGPHLSFSPQTQNGRTSSSSSSSSSSCSPSPLSPLSPTSLGQGAKSIRTIHTPSFTSYKPHNGSKSTIPSASSSKDTA